MRPDQRDLALVREWCAQQGDHVVAEPSGNAITIVDVASLHYRQADGDWELLDLDGHRFEWAEPSPELEPLLDVVAEDPTGVFWG